MGTEHIPVRTDVDKIVDTGIGLMTGSGYVPLLDEVKSAISEAEITHTDQIIDIIQEKRAKIRNNSALPANQEVDFLANTHWLFSYYTVADNEPAIRVAAYSPRVSEKYLGIVEENGSSASFPSDSTAATRESFTSALRSGMAPSDGPASIEETLSLNSRLILRLMSEMSRISSLVSEACDIGVVFLEGTMLMAKNVSIHTPNISFQVMT